jgi:hypothetical protein
MAPERVNDFEAVRFGTGGGDIAHIVRRFSACPGEVDPVRRDMR